METTKEGQRYVSRGLLGQGGRGAVYDVEDTVTGGRVALKVMLSQDPRSILRFKQEFRVMAERHHPNLVRLFDLGCEDGQWYYTMELIEGQNILDVLLPDLDHDYLHCSTDVRVTSLPLDTAEAITAIPVGEEEVALQEVACDLNALGVVLEQLLDALEFLHEQGIVHRDLKPSNILVDLDGVVRVLDFGLISDGVAQGITRDGAVMGTPAYMSPEQCEGKPATAASDIYALGCILFQLLTGQLPFAGSAKQSMYARITSPPPLVERRVRGVPSHLADACRRLMDRDPNQRPTVAEARKLFGLEDESVVSSGQELRFVDDLPFVGRADELRQLEQRLEFAQAGDLQVALIEGVSGVGKSTLAAQLRTRAEAMGFTCLGGRCYERERVPYAAFDQIVDGLILELSRWTSQQRLPLENLFELLGRIFPTIGVLHPPQADLLTPLAGEARALSSQAFDGFSHLLNHYQEHAPLLLVLDDIQWAEHESIELLLSLLNKAHGRIMVLGLFRPEGLESGLPMGRLMDWSRKASNAFLMRIERLSDAETAALLLQVLPNFPAASIPDLTSLAGGNPFLALQLAQFIKVVGADSREVLSSIDGVEALRYHLSKLSARANSVLSVAAVAGADAREDLLRAVTALSPEEYELAMAELTSARLLKMLPGTRQRRVDLYHDRIREVAYERLSDDVRVQLHRRIAVALQKLESTDVRDVEALFRHWSAVGDRPNKRRFALKAARRATSQFAFQHAASLLRVALDDPDPDEALSVTAARWERVGQLHGFSGQHPQSSEAFRQALMLWEQIPDEEERSRATLRLRACLCESLICAGQLEKGRETFNQGLAQLGLRGDRRALAQLTVLVWLRLQVALAGRLPWFAPRNVEFEREKLGFFDRMVRMMLPTWPGLAIDAALRRGIIAHRLGDKSVLIRELVTKAIFVIMIARRRSKTSLAGARSDLDRAEALAREHNIPLGLELVQVHRGILWMALDLERAKRTLNSALESFSKKGMLRSHDGAIARMFYAAALYASGDYDKLLNVIDQESSHAYFSNIPFFFTIKTSLHAFRGERNEAVHALKRFESTVDDIPNSTPSDLLQVARENVFNGHGRFTEVIAESSRVQKHPMIIIRATSMENRVNAYLGLLRRGQLDAKTHKRAYQEAKRLARYPLWGFNSQGLGGMALLDHARGHTRKSLKLLRRALRASEINCSPHRRWAVLVAAREMNQLNVDLEAEFDRLVETHRFTAFPSEPMDLHYGDG